MPITIVPNTDVQTATGVPVCFEASAIYSLPQEDERCIDLPASGTHWTFVSDNCMWKKTSGAVGTMDAPTYTGNSQDVYGLQPFWFAAQILTFTTPPSPNRFYGSLVGVKDPDGLFYGWYVWKNCGNRSVSSCNAANNDDLAQGWKAFVYVAGAIVSPVPFNVNAGEWFRIRSTGTTLVWERQTGEGGFNHWVAHYSIQSPNVTGWRFYLDSAYLNNEWYTVHTFKGTYQGSVPTTWTTPAGGALSGTGNNRCFIAGTVGTYQVCVDDDFDDPVCVDVNVTPLFLEPIDYDCGTDCVYVDSIVNFQSNGGDQGVLVALDDSGHEIGTILGPLSWQAPDVAVHVNFTYTINDVDTTCDLSVVEPLFLSNITNNTIEGLIPGDTFQIVDNYTVQGGTVVWENLDCPNIVSQAGLVTIPTQYTTTCFGALDCYIRGRVVTVPNATCANLEGKLFIDVRVIVDPIYPSPELGGPPPLKWKQETPDFRVVTNEFEGGCDETYIRNRVPIYRWTIAYDGMTYDDPSTCPPHACCEDPIGYVGGIGPTYQNARLLDEFWNYVYGTAGYFTLIDSRNNRRWSRVRFENKMERDHINWRKSQSRTVTLIWHPCCDLFPAGGTCSHTINTVDKLDPTMPESLKGSRFSPTEIHLSWRPSIDDIGVKGYVLEYTVNSVTSTLLLPEIVTFYHTRLQPNFDYTYRIRAVDFYGHYSPWTPTITVAAATTVVDGGITVVDSGINVIED